MKLNSKLKFTFIFIASIILFWSCVLANRNTENIDVVKAYYRALNQSDFNKVKSLILDSMRVTEESFTVAISKDDYHNWLEWDSVFQPTYKILEISAGEGRVSVTVSKECTRTLFLNGEPVVSKESVYVQEGKIWKTEVEAYEVFNFDQWNEKKEKVVVWVDRNYPELNGFIYDQTKTGAMNYLKVIDLFNEHEEVVTN
ncbi:MAG: hypothetical protein AAFN93_22615 [Bacteroidota bacterium]